MLEIFDYWRHSCSVATSRADACIGIIFTTRNHLAIDCTLINTYTTFPQEHFGCHALIERCSIRSTATSNHLSVIATDLLLTSATSFWTRTLKWMLQAAIGCLASHVTPQMTCSNVGKLNERRACRFLLQLCCHMLLIAICITPFSQELYLVLCCRYLNVHTSSKCAHKQLLIQYACSTNVANQ